MRKYEKVKSLNIMTKFAAANFFKFSFLKNYVVYLKYVDAFRIGVHGTLLQIEHREFCKMTANGWQLSQFSVYWKGIVVKS